jgi:hygromycin-B 4-O-kinase
LNKGRELLGNGSNEGVAMKSVKPVIDWETATRLLRDELQIDFDHLEEIDDGQIARTYWLDIGGRSCILQFTEQNMSQGCLNERFFRARFRQMEIPVRSVLHEGDFAGLHFTVAAKVQGKGLSQLPLREFVAVLPFVMDILLRIASIDTSDTTGFGWLDLNGNGRFASWREHLCQVRDEEPGQFYDRWHDLFDATFLDRGVFDYYYEKMKDLIDLTPSRRELVHGGFGYGNVLVNDGQIAAVLDWQDARYGDHIFDLAYMLFWLDGSTQEICVNAYKESLKKLGRSEAHIEDRIKCYQYYTGIDGLRFAARTENEQFYKAVLDKLSLLDGTH